MPNTPSIEEIAKKRNYVFEDGVIYRAATGIRSFNPDARSATFIMTSEDMDSYGDIVRAKGCRMERFASNPIALLNHDPNRILGTWSDVKRIVKRIEGTVTLAEAGTAPHVDMAYSLMKQNILRAASIGFQVHEFEWIEDEKGEKTGGWDFKDWELTECSVVTVPANPKALAKSIKQGNTLALQFIEEVLDTYTKTAHGLIVAKKDLEEAYKEGTGKGVTMGPVFIPESADTKKIAEFIEESRGKSRGFRFEESGGNEGEYQLIDTRHIASPLKPRLDTRHLGSPIDEEFEEDKEIEEAVEKSLGQMSIELDVDTSEFESKFARVTATVEQFAHKVREAFGIMKEIEDKEPEYVEGGLDKAKALKTRLDKSLAA